VDRVVLEKVGERRGIGKIVDCYYLDGAGLFVCEKLSKDVAPDAPESVNSNTYAHE
jgi:hypothetical protein